ncbi:hypothetical protein APA_2573 [Pseudanabaena sp. lw0831]|uniref:hypothetical protein n=1 Tax=Pseudanabaena sp. lw0831 TaxID=1357935 RepID=UPI0019150A3C|nr:hypothetical protein [Pseudanabaena sp. lw0831]GBO54626.1 hypothetical protein APA_2573 [Pseudanabaena sp. lw0831]
MSQTDEVITLQIKSRETEVVSLQIPVEAMRSLEEVATSRDMSIDGLLKFYIGQGLRQDAAKLFSDRLLEKTFATTSAVLARHIDSKEEISIIIREIQAEVVR